MKKILVVIVALFTLFTFTGCNVGAGEFEFEGTNYYVGEEVKVYFDVNGEPTNPWVWWVIDCKSLS